MLTELIPSIDTALAAIFNLLQSYWLPAAAAALIVFAIFLFLTFREKSGIPRRGAKINCQLVRVIDGDSVVLKLKRWRGDRNVRLWGIDAPEHDQPLGQQSTEHLRRLLRRRRKLRATIRGTDRYDRLVCELHHRRRNESINTLMVRQGYAYAYAHSGGRIIQGAEEEARAKRRGVWKSGDRGGERPWEYRKRSS